MTETDLEDWTPGFILSTAIKSNAQGDYVELWLKTPKGPQRYLSPLQKHVTFAHKSNESRLRALAKQHHISLHESHLTTFEHAPVIVIKADKQKHFRLFLSSCRQHNIELFEADINLTDRFLMERFVYGSIDIAKDSSNRIKPGVYRPTLSYQSIDIECDENGNLFSIGSFCSDDAVVWMVDPLQNPKSDPNFRYIPVADEASLLRSWCEYVNDTNPDVLIGWNVKQFDCRVLAEQAEKNGMSLNIGRDKSAMRVRQGKSDQYWVEIAGRAVVDGIESLKTMTLFFDNFSLDNVAYELLGKRKLIHVSNQLEKIKTLFVTDKLKLAQYNVEDCKLVSDIVEKTQLIDYLVLRSCLTGLSLPRPGGSVAAFINTYLPHVHRAGYISPNRPADGGLASPGGYVMTSRPGLYKHVVLLDFKSLYPSIIRTFLIDPVGLIEGLKHSEDAIPGFKGALFSRQNHFLPEIIDQLWAQRDQAKRNQDEPRSRAIKIIMNSFYGVLGSGGCPFYDTRLASSITMRGHEIMQRTKTRIESLGYQVIYGDTDSTFIWLEHCQSDKQANEIGESLARHVNDYWQESIRTEFNTDCHLEMEFETHFAQFFMPTIRNSELGSKKRYVGKTSTQFGDELVFKGMETVRSDWTLAAKQFQFELYRRIFADEPIDEFVQQTVDSILKGKRNADLIYRKRLKKPVESYTKTRPPHVKAAALANSQAKQEGQDEPYSVKQYIEYVITGAGPRAVDSNSIDKLAIDYAHYVEKQIKPIADSILPHINKSFARLVTGQLSLF